MIITIGNEEYERTIKLEVIPPLSNEDLNKSSQLENKNEDSIALTKDIDTRDEDGNSEIKSINEENDFLQQLYPSYTKEIVKEDNLFLAKIESISEKGLLRIAFNKRLIIPPFY